MYAGHVAIALGARGVRHDLPLWVLVLAAQACDWVELATHRLTSHLTPDLYSHAFPFVMVAAIIAAGVVWVWKRSAGAAVTVFVLYLSHPLADYVTAHKPLWLGGPSVGLDLIDRPLTDFVVQAALCVIGVAIYQRSLAPARRRRLAAAAPLVVLLVMQALADSRLEWIRQRRRPNEGTTQAGPPRRESGIGDFGEASP